MCNWIPSTFVSLFKLLNQDDTFPQQGGEEMPHNGSIWITDETRWPHGSAYLHLNFTAWPKCMSGGKPVSLRLTPPKHTNVCFKELRETVGTVSLTSLGQMAVEMTTRSPSLAYSRSFGPSTLACEVKKAAYICLKSAAMSKSYSLTPHVPTLSLVIVRWVVGYKTELHSWLVCNPTLLGFYVVLVYYNYHLIWLARQLYKYPLIMNCNKALFNNLIYNTLYIPAAYALVLYNCVIMLYDCI